MSTLFQLDGWRDALRGLILAIIMASLTTLQQLISNGGHVDWKIILTAGISGGIGFIIQKFGSDSQGKLGGKI